MENYIRHILKPFNLTLWKVDIVFIMASIVTAISTFAPTTQQHRRDIDYINDMNNNLDDILPIDVDPPISVLLVIH